MYNFSIFFCSSVPTDQIVWQTDRQNICNRCSVEFCCMAMHFAVINFICCGILSTLNLSLRLSFVVALVWYYVPWYRELYRTRCCCIFICFCCFHFNIYVWVLERMGETLQTLGSYVSTCLFCSVIIFAALFVDC